MARNDREISWLKDLRSMIALSAPRVEPVADWQDDPSADERWNAGLDFGMVQLCAVLAVDPHMVNWDAATETLDGDVSAAICNIFRTKYGEDFDPSAAPPSQPDTRVREVPSEELKTVGEKIHQFAQQGEWVLQRRLALAALPPDAGSRKPALDPATVEAAHKVMTMDEYLCRPRLKGWHSVCWDYDGFDSVGVRYHGEAALTAKDGA